MFFWPAHLFTGNDRLLTFTEPLLKPSALFLQGSELLRLPCMWSLNARIGQAKSAYQARL